MECSSRPSAGLRPRALSASCAIAVILLVFIPPFVSGAYRGDLANDGDEAAHFITGMVAFDYCRTSLGSNPVAFAEAYYVRYPKVAVGHWPPAFYGVQVLWYLAFCPSTFSALLLTGVTAAVTAVCLFRRLERSYGSLPALLAVALLLSQPLVRFHSAVVMADMQVCLFCLLAVLAFSDFLLERRPRKALAFASWSSLAILTKGTALALGLFVPLAIVMSGNWGILRSRSLWLAGALVVLLSAPWYLATMLSGRGLHGHTGIVHLVDNSAHFHERPPIFGDLFQVASPGLFLMAGIGALGVLARSSGPSASRRWCDARAAVAWVVAIVLFQTLSPIRSPRYCLPVVLPLTILTAHGLCAVHGLLSRYSKIAALLALALLLAFTLMTPRGYRRDRIAGYASVAEKIPFLPGGRVLLISSDSLGEGAFIVERLLRDSSRSDVVLRGDKVLSESSWNGDMYRLRMTTTAEVRAYLDALPVHFIVLDHYGHRGEKLRPHHTLLREVLAAAPDDFPRIGVCPVSRGGKPCKECIEVYENLRAREHTFRVIRIDMSNTQLGRILELRNPNAEDESDPRHGQGFRR